MGSGISNVKPAVGPAVEPAPVDPDPAGDRAEMEKSYAQPDRFDERKLFPGSSLEFQRPTPQDFWGFVICFAICFGVIGLAILGLKIGT